VITKNKNTEKAYERVIAKHAKHRDWILAAIDPRQHRNATDAEQSKLLKLAGLPCIDSMWKQQRIKAFPEIYGSKTIRVDTAVATMDLTASQAMKKFALDRLGLGLAKVAKTKRIKEIAEGLESKEVEDELAELDYLEGDCY
jgi:hypothetical protein